MCCDLVLGGTWAVLWEQSRAPQLLWAAGAELPMGNPPLSIQSCHTWSHLCIFQRGSGLAGQRETEELLNKLKWAFLELANSDTWGFSCQGLYITMLWLLKHPQLKPQVTHSEKKLWWGLPKYHCPVLKGTWGHPIATPQYHTCENVLPRICRPWGLKPQQMALLTALVKCFHCRLSNHMDEVHSKRRNKKFLIKGLPTFSKNSTGWFRGWWFPSQQPWTAFCRGINQEGWWVQSQDGQPALDTWSDFQQTFIHLLSYLRQFKSCFHKITSGHEVLLCFCGWPAQTLDSTAFAVDIKNITWPPHPPSGTSQDARTFEKKQKVTPVTPVAPNSWRKQVFQTLADNQLQKSVINPCSHFTCEGIQASQVA